VEAHGFAPTGQRQMHARIFIQRFGPHDFGYEITKVDCIGIGANILYKPTILITWKLNEQPALGGMQARSRRSQSTDRARDCLSRKSIASNCGPKLLATPFVTAQMIFEGTMGSIGRVAKA
jgi:hypothetical protein